MIGFPELVLILLVALLLFGAKRIEDVASSLGRSLNAFKKGMRAEDDPRPEKPAAGAAVPAKTEQPKKTE